MLHAATLAELRTRVRAIEAPGRAARVAGFGDRRLDHALPWGGLPLGCLHEVAGIPGDFGAAMGFAAAAAVRIAAATPSATTILWCARPDAWSERGALYAPGLSEFGVAPERLLVVRASTPEGVLWAMEEGLRCPGLVLVVGEVDAVGFTASRRLQLAAEASGVTALLVHPLGAAGASGAVTRWRVASRASARSAAPSAPWHPAWSAELTHCRGGNPSTWNLEWHHAQSHFTVVAGVSDRPAQPQPAQAAG